MESAGAGGGNVPGGGVRSCTGRSRSMCSADSDDGMGAVPRQGEGGSYLSESLSTYISTACVCAIRFLGAPSAR